MNKFYVTPELKTTITCPKCKKTKRANVSKFLKLETRVKLKCRCNRCDNEFSALLERRRSKRKNVSMPGWLIVNGRKDKILIENISMHGLKIRLLNETELVKKQRVGIKFEIGDSMSSCVSSSVRIKKIFNSTRIGCEYLNFDHAGNLGKYFMFYF